MLEFPRRGRLFADVFELVISTYVRPFDAGVVRPPDVGPVGCGVVPRGGTDPGRALYYKSLNVLI